MSEEEFANWNHELLWAEWLDGRVSVLKPANADHADLSSFLLHLIAGFVDEFDLGKIFRGRFQLRLADQHSRRIPDLYFVANERLHIVERTQCNGSPDLIVEIVSTDSKVRDCQEKFQEYENAKVREYWLIDQPARRFEMFGLNADEKFAAIPSVDGAVRSVVLDGLFFRPEWVWQLQFPKVAPLLADMARQRRKRSSTRKA